MKKACTTILLAVLVFSIVAAEKQKNECSKQYSSKNDNFENIRLKIQKKLEKDSKLFRLFYGNASVEDILNCPLAK